MGSELLPSLYGIASALIWGAGDFNGGLATRKTAVHVVVLLSQIVGGLMLIALALGFKEPLPAIERLLFGAAAGIAGGIGLIAFYHGLAYGKMGLMAPLTGLISAGIPVVVGIALEGLPGKMKLVGIGLALLSVWFLSTDDDGGRLRWPDVLSAIIAGLGFSLFFVFVDQASNAGAVFWPMVAARGASVFMMLVIGAFRRNVQFPARLQLGIIGLAGVFDSGGNLFFVLASQVGRLDIASVLSSLYPASTVLLAWIILQEKLHKQQRWGVLIALAALMLITL